ncbi:hypothetical protein GQ44DRAFT_763661 [Phaeosphaeriaceae sp. PMI808]|nr:hypothetical protein GQ44DRAFT_763661 [Phaeosphaeriaceae sp. PMI808]
MTTSIENGVQQLAMCYQNTQDGDERKKILGWLPSTDYTDRQNALQRERHEGTGQWFLDTVEFRNWLHQKGSILFCPGMPGAGKSHTASLVIHHLQTSKHSESIPGLAYIYCEYTQQHTREALLTSLLEQLARPQHPLPVQLITLYEIHGEKRTQPLVNELWAALRDIASIYERCFIVVDGLDECTDDEGVRDFLLETLIKLQRSSDVNILATSRDIQHIQYYFKDCSQIRIKAQDNDIGQYLDHRIPRVLPLLADNLGLCRKIKAVIMTAASRMFLLAILHVTSLKGKVNVKAIEDALAELESGGSSLIAAYDKTIKIIESQKEGYQKLAKDTLS